MSVPLGRAPPAAGAATTNCAAPPAAGAATTTDALFHGRVVLVQPTREAGYRVNVDALLLAAFAGRTLEGSIAPALTARRACDLGAGVGAVGLSLLHFGSAEHVTMIEVDATLTRLAETNARENGWADRVDVVCSDVAEANTGPADLVVCNPPYVPEARGRRPAPARARARTGSLEIFTTAARRIAGRRARVCFVYPAHETATLLVRLRSAGLEPKRLRPVHGAPRTAARVVLVECAAAKAGGLAIEPAFVETDGRGSPSAALAALVGHRGATLR